MLCLLVCWSNPFVGLCYSIFCFTYFYNVGIAFYICRVGGVLRILQADKFIDEQALRGFLLTCQSEVILFLRSATVAYGCTIMLLS